MVSLSWLGDCVMAMPALMAFRKRLPGAHITMLAKPSVAPLWTLFPGIDEVIPLNKGFRGMRETIRLVKAGHFDFAYIFPKSFRSAWIPWLANVPGRRGLSGQVRGWMLTESLQLTEQACIGHQSLEIAEVLHIPSESLKTPPFLVVPEPAMERAHHCLQGSDSWVAFFPGASYGPAKRWPADRFAWVGRKLISEQGARIVVLGGKADKSVCDTVVAAIGEGAVSLAGETDLPELAGLLRLCRAVVANDSGGMHLAAGMGVDVVGIFGLTDPVKTAPVGLRSRVITAEGVTRSRDISRDSSESRAALESISGETVYQAVLDFMGKKCP